MNTSTNRYFNWTRIENQICKIFQRFYNTKNNCSTFLKKRTNKQASIDFIWNSYNKDWITKNLSVEVRSLNKSYNELIKINNWNIDFPIQKLNELMMFWRLKKENYIVYKLDSEVYFINWEYYLSHNFSLEKKIISKEKWYNKEIYVIRLPLRNFVYIWKYNFNNNNK